MRLLQSLSFRLALTYVGLFCLSVVALLALYYWISLARPLEQIRTGVDREARALSHVYILDGQAELIAALEERAARSDPRKPFHAFIDPAGRTLSANLPSWPETPSAGWVEIEADIYYDGDETDHHALTRDILFRDGARLLVGRDAEDIADRRELIGQTAAWILGGTLLLGIVGGGLMSVAIRARIDAVSGVARRVMEGDLSGRVPLRGTGDDFDRLGALLNAMLERNEALFESVRRVSDSVAHELRTPLTRHLAALDRLETAVAGDPAGAAAAAAIAEGRRLRRIFDALLRISRIESGRHEPALRPVDLGMLARDVGEFHAPDAEERGVALDVVAQDDVAVQGDPDLLFQALSNLADNALKYTPAGGRVTIRAGLSRGVVMLGVEDSGPGMALQDRARATERFYRAEGSVGKPGEGLGLSLVEAVAGFHGARLELADNRPGLRAMIVWPA